MGTRPEPKKDVSMSFTSIQSTIKSLKARVDGGESGAEGVVHSFIRERSPAQIFGLAAAACEAGEPLEGLPSTFLEAYLIRQVQVASS